jgi:hypothetical protein
MTSVRSRARVVPLVLVAAAVSAAAACGSASKQSASATGSGGSTSSSGSISSGSSSSSSGAGGGAPSPLTLPQFVHGAAYVDTIQYPASVPLVIAYTGATPDSVDVTVDGVAVTATPDTGRFIAPIATTFATGPHAIVATAKKGGSTVGTVSGSLVAGAGSFEFTKLAVDGNAETGTVVHDVPGDSLLYTWVSVKTGKHQLYMNRLDGAFARTLANDVVLNDPSDEPLNAYPAVGPTGIGVVYRVSHPSDSHWTVKLRVVDPTGKEVVPATDLTSPGSAFTQQAAGADPGGFSAAWLQITPPGDGGALPPVEIRFARWDIAAGKLVGPITLDSDQPADPADPADPQILEPLAEMSIACNTAVCLVSYVRDIYNSETGMPEQKVLVATVDLASGTLKGTPAIVAGASDPNPEFWGNSLVALPDGTFVLVYQETLLLPPACTMPLFPAPNDTCCDDPNNLSSDAFFTAKFDATGALVGSPKQLYAAEGMREYPRIAPHPDGYALFWEDERTECSANLSDGHIRMSSNVASGTLTSVLDPYVELPSSIALPGEQPTLGVLGTNFVTSWTDARFGDSVLAPMTEQVLDTYWRK